MNPPRKQISRRGVVSDKSWPRVVRNGSVEVKIYHRQNKGKDVFQVADYSNGRGKRLLRTFTKLEKATQEAQRLADLIAAGEVEAAKMGSREASEFGQSVNRIRTTGDSLLTAADRYAQAVELLGGDGSKLVMAAKEYAERHPEDLKDMPIDKAIDGFVASKKSRSIRYTKDLQSKLNRLAHAFKMPVNRIARQDLQLWFDQLTLSEQSKRSYRTVLNTFFEFCRRRRYVVENPVADIEKYGSSNADLQVFSPEELSKLIHSAPLEFLPAMVIGAFAGLRTAEIERLSWRDISLTDGQAHIEITAKKAKTKSRRIVPVSDNLREFLLDNFGAGKI